jgi:hypothetical protein
MNSHGQFQNVPWDMRHRKAEASILNSSDAENYCAV